MPSDGPAPERAGQEGRSQHDQRGDLCPVSSAQQKHDEAIASQTAALREVMRVHLIAGAYL